MSHKKASVHGGNSEPNLTPLLDMVLQLVMFFVMVANFSMEQANADIRLPDATAARPTEKTDSEVLYLNLNDKGEILVLGHEPLGATEIYGYLKDQYNEAAELARDRKKKGLQDTDQVKTVVIIRADKNSDFGPVYNVLRQAKAAGFRKWQLRVNHKNV
jgi:biopolymer transport protein ExbD